MSNKTDSVVFAITTKSETIKNKACFLNLKDKRVALVESSNVTY